MIEIKNLSKYYSNGGITTLGLQNITLSFKRNEIVGIVGESGSGKSTLLNVISGMDSYDDGEILFNGEETSYFDETDRDIFRKKNVAFINQNYNIIDSYTVLDNVALPLLINGVDEKEAIKQAKKLIEKVHLSHRIKSKGSQLSGGEKQRCVIARALAKNTPILACDEPTGNLDSKTGEEIINLLKEVSEDKLVLIVTHNEEQADPILTRKIRIHDGMVTEDISMRDFFSRDGRVESAEQTKTPKWLRARIAWKNIKGTPKKNIFSTIVFTAFSFVMIYLYLLSTMSGYNSGFLNSSNYKNTAHDRILVYRDDHQPLNTSKLDSIKGNKSENPFYEDLTLLAPVGDSYWASYVTLSKFAPHNTQIIKEIETSTSTYASATIICPSKDGSFYDSSIVGKEIRLYDFDNLDIGWLNVKKYGVCDELTYPLVVVDDVNSAVFWRPLQSYYELKAVNCSDGTVFSSELYTKGAGPFDDSSDNVYTANTLIHYGKNHLSKPTSLTCSLGNIYDVSFSSFDYEERIDPYYDDFFEFHVYDCPMPSDCYEMSIYCENVDDAIETVRKAGYQYVIPSRAASEAVKRANINSILVTMLYVLVTLLGLILTLAVYAILSRVYLTKAKDFTIFRSLGILKGDLRGAVNLEISFIALLSSGISIAAIFTLAAFTDYFANIIAFANVWVFLIFIVVMQLMALIVSNRFNKKIFKLTITDSLKEERR